MYSTPARKFLSVFMAAVLVLTCNSGTINPVSAWAENSAAQTQTADDQADAAANETGENGSDAEQQSAADQREAADVTNNAGILALTLAKLTYSVDGQQKSIAAEGNALDASDIDVSAASDYALTYTAKAAAELLESDTVKASLPKGALSVDQDRLAAANDAATAKVATDDSGKQTVTFTLSAAVEEGQQVELAIPVQLDAEQLGEEAAAVTLPLPGDANTTVTLPAAPAEEEADDEAADESADKASEQEDDSAATESTEEGISTLSANEDGVDTQSNDGTVTLKKYWYDGSDSNRPEPSALIGDNGLKIYYSVDDGKSYKILTSADSMTLGMSNVPEIKCSNSKADNPYVYSAVGLATTYNGNSVLYKIVEAEDGDLVTIGNSTYKAEVSEDGSTVNNVKTKNFSFTLKMHNGTETWAPKEEELAKLLEVTDNSGNPVTISEGQIGITDNGDGSYAVTIAGLPMYSSKDALGTEIGYKATLANTDRTESGDGVYSSEYNNAAVPNYGSDTSAVHEGGTIDYLRKDDTAYTATKKWLDGDAGAANRPDATFTLWRYVDNGENTYRNAAQVLDASGKAVTVTAARNENTVKLEIPTVDGTPLPKYNADGYEYIYLTRESMSGTNANAYEQVFDDAASRNGDVSVYNGDTVSNHLAGKVEASVTKTWVASAHQSYFANYKVTMGLQQRLVNDGTWENVIDNGEQKTVELSGFATEITSKTDTTVSMPKYDADGYELEYRWVELSITDSEGDHMVDYGSDASSVNGTATTSYNVTSSEGRQNEDYYTVANTTVDSATETVNKLEGKVDYQVTKKWVDSNGDPIEVAGDATYALYKDGSPVATFTVTTEKEQNGKIMSGDTELGSYTVTTPSTGVQTITISDLAKYTDDGTLVSYFVSEDSGPAGFVPSYQYDNDNRSAVITNKPGTPGVEIRVEKQWLDDSDTASRLPVTFEVSYTSLKTGETVSQKVEVSAKTNWFKLVGLGGEDEVDKDSIKVIEKYVTDTDGTKYNVAYSNDTATGSLTTKVGGKEVDGYKYVTVNKQQQGTAGGYPNYVSTNRRVGTVNLTVTKTWNDTGADKTERPSADVKLSALNAGVTVGQNYVALEGEGDVNHYIVGKADEGNPLAALFGAAAQSNGTPSTDDHTTLDGTVVNAIQSVKSTDSDTVTVYYYGLPKYDMQGRVISYSVDEELGSDAAEKDYSKSVTVDDYTIGSDYHFTDFQSVAVTNSRSKTVDLTVNKKWLDAYQKNLGHRSDLSLTLWEKFKNSNGSDTVRKYKVYGYKDYSWSVADNGSDPNYLTADFKGLPKYTDDGAEITYYFEETYNNPKATTDYDYNRVSYDGGEVIYLDSDNNVVTDADAATHTLLQDGGTFTNGISDTVNVEGEKVWKNIPSAIRSDVKLPNVTIEVYQQSQKKDAEKTLVATVSSKEPNGKKASDTEEGANGFLSNDNASNTWSYVVYYKDGDASKSALPKYDDEGYLYDYTIEEKVASDPALQGAEWNVIYNENFSDFTAANEYNQKNYAGQITVAKTWNRGAIAEADDKYPVVTFTAHQMYKKSDGSYVEVQAIDKKLDANATAPDNNKNTVTFSDLAVYAPDGSKYLYYVTEKATAGDYTCTMTEPTDASAKGTYAGSDGKAHQLYELTPGTYNETSKTWTAGEALAYSATNEYSVTKFSVKANKYWSDTEDALGIRPNSIQLKITRSAKANGGNNAIASETIYDDSTSVNEIVENCITWNKDDAGKWVFTVSDLERYAPNGAAWQYTVTEAAVPTGYVKNGSVQFDASSTKAGETLDLTSAGTNQNNKMLENKFGAQVSIAKTWNDSGNKYGTRPAYVKVELQYATMTDLPATDTIANANWQNVSNNDKLLKVVQAHIAAKNNVNTALGADGTFMVNLSSTTTQTWSNLPAVLSVADGTQYLAYRLVEVTEDEAQGVAHPKGGASADSTTLKDYDATNGATTVSASKFTTAVTNKLETEGLEITKGWDDGDNAFGLRLGSVTFKLQYKAVSAGEDAWATYKVNGNDLTVTLTAAKSWKDTISDLPKCAADGTQYEWRASEVAVPNYTSSYGTTGGQAEKGDTSFTAATNKLNTFPIQLDKIGGDTKASLNDVSIECYKGNSLVFTWTRDASGKVTVKPGSEFANAGIAYKDGSITGLPTGTYTLKEVSAPEQYNQHEQLTFAIAADGAVSSTTEGAVSGTKVTMTDPLAKTDLTVTKKLGSDNLPGVTFQLQKQSNGSYADVEGVTCTTDENGKAKFSDLGVGNYRLVETSVPANVVLETGKYYFSVANTDNGKVVATKDGSATDAATIAIGADGKSASISNAEFNASIQFTKIDATDKSTIKGAVFELRYNETEAGNYSKLKELTSTDGTYSAAGLKKGYYQLVETKAPTGYTAAGEKLGDDSGEYRVAAFQVKEGQNGKTVDVNTGEALASGKTATIANDRILGTVSLKKYDTDKNPLKDCTFELQTKNADGSWVAYAGDNADGTYVTGDNGAITISNLPWAQYRIHESKASAGYLTGDNGEWREFTVDANHTVVDMGNYTNSKSSIDILKTDEEGNALAGASFELLDSEGTVKATWTSSEEAFNIQYLTEGEEYTLAETSRAAGYFANNAEAKFTLNNKGEIQLTDNMDGMASVDANNKMQLVVKNTAVKADFSFTKIGYINENCADGSLNGGAADASDYKALAGAEFTLSAVSGKSADGKDFANKVVTSAEDGTVSFKDVPEGAYTLKETGVPEGYVAHADMSVQVSGEGIVRIDPGDGNDAFDLNPNDQYACYNKLANLQDLTFTKVSDVDRTTPIAGAVYELYRLGTDDAEGVLIAKSTSDESGLVSFAGLLPDTKYRIHESVASAGSLLSADDVIVQFAKNDEGNYELQIVDDGSAEVDGKEFATAYINAEGNMIWEEPQTEYLFSKEDANGERLAGASLELQASDGTVIDSWTSSADDGYLIAGKLVYGETYKLVETAAPSGYEVADPIEFKVGDEEGEAVTAGREHTVVITMVDQESSEPGADNGADVAASGTRTGDTLGMFAIGVAVVALIAGGMALIASRQRPRGKHSR